MADQRPILVTGAAGSFGGVSRTVVEILRGKGLPVRAFVHRDDDRAEALRALGAETVAGDLARAPDVVRALAGCGRAFFSMSVSPVYLEATATTAVVARDYGRLELFVNMSQLTVSQMDVTSTSESRQQRLHWLSESVLDWSGLPVAQVRPTIFMETFVRLFGLAASLEEGEIRLPFGSGRTSPVAARDVAEVVAAILADPDAGRHRGRTYELTGPRSRDLTAMAAEFAEALGRPVTYHDVPYERWVERELTGRGLPEHVFQHLTTMARLHADNRYDRRTDDVEKVIGRKATGVPEFVRDNPGLFGK
jgi:NAD(P)H dehydrogenase (quinone)